MKEANSNFKNSGNDEDDLIEFFSGNNNCLSEPSHGIGDYSIYAEEFHEKDIPVKVGDRTRLMLTHPNHMITHFEKSFIEMTVTFSVYLNSHFDDAAFNLDTAGLNYIFVGFKDAVEIISECKFYCKGQLIGSYNQNEMIRESFAYNSIRPKDVKNGTSHAHSLWEDVINMSPNVAGCYIPLSKLYYKSTQKAKSVPIRMELLIPFTDQLALQYWRLYPNYLLGDIIEEIKTSLDGLVWCQIPPANVARIKKIRQHDSDLKYIAPINLGISNHFTQIGQEACIVGKIDTAAEHGVNTYNENGVRYNITKKALMVQPNSTEIKIGRTNCIGFNIKDEVSDAITNIFKSGKEIRVPALELRRVLFDQNATIKGLNVVKILPIHNTTNIKVMFPRNINDITVFRNIMYENCQLIIDKTAIPYNAYQTTYDSRFVQLQLMSYELDNTSACKELVESISQPLNDVSEYKKDCKYPRFLTGLYDDTNFGINFQLDRGNAGFNFEGTTTKGHQVMIKFQGQPVAKNLKNNDPYDTYFQPYTNNLGVIIERTETLPPPELWLFEYNYWSWTIDGVDYKTDHPDWMSQPVSTSNSGGESSFGVSPLL